MPTQIGYLDTSVSATLSASGTATASIAPPGNERWRIRRVAVATNQAASVVTIPVCKVYKGSIADANLWDATYTGSQDATDADEWLEKNQPFIAQWTGGVAATVGTMSLFGERWSY